MKSQTTFVKTSGLPADAYCAVCPTRMALDRIAGKWPVLIVDALGERKLRFGELSRKIEGISQKMLSLTLRQMEEDGFVTRTIFPSVPVKVEYDLTSLGRSLQKLMHQIRAWSEFHVNDIEEARRRYKTANQQSLKK